MRYPVFLSILFVLLTFLPAAYGQKQSYSIETMGTLSIGDTMVLKKGSYTDAKWNDAAQTIAVSGNSAAFEPKAVPGSEPYARLIIDTVMDKPGTYSKVALKFDPLTPEQQSKFDAQFRSGVESGLSAKSKLVRWDGFTTTTLGGYAAMKVAYVRQLEGETPVHVESYVVQNNDRMHTITLSYRESEAGRWKTVLEQARDSIAIKAIF